VSDDFFFSSMSSFGLANLHLRVRESHQEGVKVLARSVSVFAQGNGVLFEVVNCANVSRSVRFLRSEYLVVHLHRVKIATAPTPQSAKMTLLAATALVNR